MFVLENISVSKVPNGSLSKRSKSPQDGVKETNGYLADFICLQRTASLNSLGSLLLAPGCFRCMSIDKMDQNKCKLPTVSGMRLSLYLYGLPLLICQILRTLRLSTPLFKTGSRFVVGVIGINWQGPCHLVKLSTCQSVSVSLKTKLYGKR